MSEYVLKDMDKSILHFGNYIKTTEEGKELMKRKKEIGEKYKSQYKGDKFKLLLNIVEKAREFEEEENLLRSQDIAEIAHAKVAAEEEYFDAESFPSVATDLGSVRDPINSGTPLKMHGQENTRERARLGQYAPDDNHFIPRQDECQ